LSNALKFTDAGRVTLEIRPADGGRGVAFAVRDTGIGIPLEKQKLIFEAFQQADGTTSRKYGGTGLGLTISREIARLLGGVIEVESVPLRGSTFTLLLPEVYKGPEAERTFADEPEPAAPVPPLPPEADFRGRRVLIMDDDPRNIFAISTILEDRGMTVFHAENGKSGLAALQAQPDVDMVLMDTMMPEMDGLEATRRIRAMPEFERLPILFLTAKAMKGDRQKCLQAGASDYITKPVDVDRLLSLMHLWLSKSAAVRN
jgi:CheY-like chemotaxis protein